MMEFSDYDLLVVAPMKSIDVIRLVYEKFRPFTKSSGPLSARKLLIDGEEGTLYLSEFQYWLWTSEGGSKELTHTELDLLRSPQELLKHLLSSAIKALSAAEAHLERIQCQAPDVPSMLGYYLTRDAETMTDMFATGSFFTIERNEHWKRIKKSSES